MKSRKEIGKLGENIAVEFLLKKGYTIIERNWRFKKAEIDIIAKNGPFIVFIEVKCRSTEIFGPPEQSINNKKEKLYKIAAEQYLDFHHLENELRFDVISIIYNKNKSVIKHYINAF